MSTKIEVTNRYDEGVPVFRRLLRAGQIGIRVITPKEWRNDYICKDADAADTLLYLLQHTCAAVTYKKIVNEKPDPVPPSAGFRLID